MRSGRAINSPARLAARAMWVKGIVPGAIAVSLIACAGPVSICAGDSKQGPPRLDGSSGQYTLLHSARIARLTPFQTADGETINLSRFRGKIVLLNFWATWCAPCVYEMPSLDRLAAEMGGGKFVVVPVSIDETGPAAATAFYRDHSLNNLDIFSDPDQRTAYRDAGNPNDAEFALYGLPISYILDHEGRTMGYIAGAVDWQSDSARALIRYYTGRISSRNSPCLDTDT